MFQAKEAAKYFRNLPNCNIRNKSKKPPSVKKKLDMFYVSVGRTVISS